MDDAQILVATNSEKIQKKFLMSLAEWKVAITSVYDGRGTLEKVASCAFDLIFLDTGMPAMDACKASLAVRCSEIRDLKNLPIIALVNKQLSEDEQKWLEAGMNGFLTKPIEAKLLVSTVGRWITLAKRSEFPQANVQETPLRTQEKGPDRIPHSLPGLALQKTLKNLGADLDLYLELLQQYVTGKAGFCNCLRKTLDEGHIEKARILVHGLKGVTGNLGIEDVAEMAGCLEIALLEGEKGVIGPVLDRFDAKQEVALRSIQSLLKKEMRGL